MSLDEQGLAIVACGGTLPREILFSAKHDGRSLYCIAIENEADPETLAIADARFDWGQVGAFFSFLEKNDITKLLFAGHVNSRPDISTLSKAVSDVGTLRRLPKILKALKGGDDTTLGGIIKFFEEEGFQVIGVQDLASDLFASAGVHTNEAFGDDFDDDIALGFAYLNSTAEFDVGQSVVVCEGRILAVEGAEGTDAMIERVKILRAEKRYRSKKHSPILIKAEKSGQDKRIDMPTIGPGTIRNAVDAELAGIVVQTGSVLMVERDLLLELANKAGLFVVGRDLEQRDG